jgi:hypothetical protein
VIFQKAKKASPSILIKFWAEIISLATQIMIQGRSQSTRISTKKTEPNKIRKTLKNNKPKILAKFTKNFILILPSSDA